MSADPREGAAALPWLAGLRTLRERQTWVWLHRWIGLVMTLFLVIAGITGTLLPFYGELDALANPRLHRLSMQAADTPLLDAITLRERAQAAFPSMRIDSAIAPYRRDQPVILYMEPRAADGAAADDEIYLDPFTGAVLGTRRWGDISQGMTNLMPFLYRLHYSLALGTIGTYAFGIIALLWTLDCFIGAYLTFPRGRPFLEKWKPAWGIKRKRFNYDLHRASGLWTWAMLFVLAWSSVALNLNEVYRPITAALLGLAVPEELPERAIEPPGPGMSWRAAYGRGQELMRAAAVQYGVGAHREDALRYDAHRNEFNYYIATRFRNGDEAYDWFGVTFDANTGALLRVNPENLPQEKPGDFFTRWIIDLHFAHVWGLPYRIFVSAMGIVVTTLSITGLVIWWRKRRVRRVSMRQ